MSHNQKAKKIESETDGKPRTVIFYNVSDAHPDVFPHDRFAVSVNSDNITIKSLNSKNTITVPMTSIWKYQQYD